MVKFVKRKLQKHYLAQYTESVTKDRARIKGFTKKQDQGPTAATPHCDQLQALNKVLLLFALLLKYVYRPNWLSQSQISQSKVFQISGCQTGDRLYFKYKTQRNCELRVKQ